MSRIKEWFMEFCHVLKVTPQMEYTVAAAFALPSLLFAGGTWLINSLDTSGPYGAMVVAVEGPFEMIFAVLSGLLFFSLIARAAAQYRKARARLHSY
jgi:hypothetical protein